MSNSGNDKQFDGNLRAFGDVHDVPTGASVSAREACMDMLDEAGTEKVTRRRSFWSKPLTWSAMGMAASVALIVSLLGPWGSVPRVSAAEVMRRLQETVTGSGVIELKMNDIIVDGTNIDGELFVSESAVAGSMAVESHDDAGALELAIDMTMGIADGGGWVIVHDFESSDRNAMALAMLFLNQTGDTMILLPEGEGPSSINIDMGLDSGELLNSIRELITQQPDSGATIEELSDGDDARDDSN